MDRLQMLEAFLHVVEAGNFAAAAERLGVDRAVVTRRLTMLEQTLGRRLLQRSTRKLALTPEGEALLADAVELRARAQAFFSTDEPDAFAGVVRVRCSHSLAAFGAVDVLESFARRHPGLSIEIQPSEKLRPIVETGADLVLAVDAAPEPGAVAHRLGGCPSVYAASPDYWKQRGRPKSIEDWAGVRLLALANETKWTPGGVVVHVTRENAPVRYGTAWLAYRAALKGAGVARLPAVAMRGDLESGRLVALLPPEASELSVWAVLPSRHWVKPAVRALLADLRAHYGVGDLDGASPAASVQTRISRPASDGEDRPGQHESGARPSPESERFVQEDRGKDQR